jgi:flagellar biosynthesis protein FlhA
LLEEVRDRQGGLVEELIPNILTISDVQRILQNLLSENVTIANIDLIFEHLVDLARNEKDVGMITELVRQRLNYSICNALRDRNPDLAVISLDPRIENQILSALNSSNNVNNMVVDPKLAQNLISKLAQISLSMQNQGRNPVLLCDSAIRRQMRALTKRTLPKLSVLAVTEIPMNINLTSFDIVKFET